MSKINFNTKKLQPMQAMALQRLNESPCGWVNTFELRDVGIISSAACISNLRARGAIIERELRPAIDHLGNEHERVAHYRFMGWAHDG